MKFLKKKKLTVMIAAGLAGVSLSSVGFAGWVINAQTEAKKNINVSFGSVGNSSYLAEILTGEGESDLKLAFDSNKAGLGTNNVRGDGNKEHLTFKVVFKIFKKDSSMSGQDVYNDGLTSFDIVFSNYSTLNTLVSSNGKNLIKSPVVFSDKALNIPLTEGASSKNVDNGDGSKATYDVTYDLTAGMKVTLTYTFAWGDQFGGKNPLDCVDATKQKEGLEEFKKVTTESSVQLGIKITPKLA